MSHVLIVVYERYHRDSRVRRHARALCAAGHEVEVVALGAAAAQRAALSDGVSLTSLGESKYRGASQRRYLLAYVAFTLRAMQRVARQIRARRADLVYINNPPDFLVYAGLPARLRRVPVVLDIHDMTSDLYGAKFGGGFRQRIAGRAVKLVEQLCYRFADGLITVHDQYASRIRDVVGDARPVATVWNVPDRADWLDIGDARLSSEQGAYTSTLRLGHHGTIVERFGADTAVEAVALLRNRGRDVSLSILGDGDFAPALEAKIARLGLEDVVDFQRRTFDADEVPRFVATIDIGLAPYRPSDFIRRSLPVKVLEYLSLGVPVITTATDPILALISADAVRTLSSATAEELAAAIEELADADVRARFMHAGRPAARRLGWDVQSAELTEAIQGLLDDPTSAAPSSSST